MSTPKTIIVEKDAILARSHADTHVRAKRDLEVEVIRPNPDGWFITVRFKGKDYEVHRLQTRNV